MAACGGDACAEAISRLLAANVSRAVETPAFAKSLGRIPRQRRRDAMKHWGTNRRQSQESRLELGLGVSRRLRRANDLDS